MIEIAFYSLLTILITFTLGSGITLLFVPEKIKPFTFWLIPWFLFVFLILALAIFSLFGLSVQQTSPFLFVGLLVFTIYVVFKQKKPLPLELRRDVVIGMFVAISIVLNVSPLLKRDKFLTTISFGNNDVIAYATVADYLVEHSIRESFHTDVILSISNLLHDGYRWGPSILEAFFLHVLQLEGYQYTFLFQVILFALMLPLVSIFFTVLYKYDFAGMILSLTITTFNANLLYVLYHNFFGQVIYWGLGLLLLIFFFAYLEIRVEKIQRLTRYDIAIGLAIGALYLCYHEAAFFMLGPLFIYLFLMVVLRRNVRNYLRVLGKIVFVAFVLASVAIFNAIVFDFGQAFGGLPNQPIGWQLFRQSLPFANPFEMLGFYSLHNFAPMNNIFAIPLSLLVVLAVFYGLFKAKNRLLLISYTSVFLFFFYWMGIVMQNFFDYNRVLTYTLLFFIVLFVVGTVSLLARVPKLKMAVIFILIVLVVYSGTQLNKRFIAERASVDQSYISLKALPTAEIKEAIYTEGTLSSNVPIWKEIWTGYFIYPHIKNELFPKEYVGDIHANRVPDNSLVLLSKPTPWYGPPRVLLKEVVWENEYYKLGRLCNDVECLLSGEEDLSNVKMGRSEFEDSLLTSGWSVRESANRWANAKESTLRLVVKPGDSFSRLVIEAQTLAEPQSFSLIFDGELVGEKTLVTEWGKYEFKIGRIISPGVHKILLQFSNIYRPIDVVDSQDTRELTANFREIRLE